jgi:hypothetical protein
MIQISEAVLTACDVATISSAGRTWVSLGDGVGPPTCVDLYTSISGLLYPIFILFSDSQSHHAWGDINLFYKRLRKSPIVYPEFEHWVDRRVVNTFHLSMYPGCGYYIKNTNSLLKLLTHPLHYGYRPVNDVIRRDEQGNKIREFEPVIELDLLNFAYYRLAK